MRKHHIMLGLICVWLVLVFLMSAASCTSAPLVEQPPTPGRWTHGMVQGDQCVPIPVPCRAGTCEACEP